MIGWIGCGIGMMCEIMFILGFYEFGMLCECVVFDQVDGLVGGEVEFGIDEQVDDDDVGLYEIVCIVDQEVEIC